MAGATGLYARTATSDARARATRFVSDTLGADAERTRWVLEVRQGRPGHVLADLSGEAALLVVGTGDHVGLRRVLLGSVSHYCLSHAACPVVAVPAAGRAADLDRPADTRVGAGTDIPG
jgi:nucleotide-binding universal stress UspA family protein